MIYLAFNIKHCVFFLLSTQA